MTADFLPQSRIRYQFVKPACAVPRFISSDALFALLGTFFAARDGAPGHREITRIETELAPAPEFCGNIRRLRTRRTHLQLLAPSIDELNRHVAILPYLDAITQEKSARQCAPAAFEHLTAQQKPTTYIQLQKICGRIYGSPQVEIQYSRAAVFLTASLVERNSLKAEEKIGD